MLRSLLTTALVAASFAAPAAAQGAPCPFSGVSTITFGTGSGACSPAVLTVALDPSTCRMDFGFAPEAFLCGNVFLFQNALLVGASALTPGVPLGPEFLPNSTLEIVPLVVLGPFPGKAAELSIPADPSLVGATVFFQSVPFYAITIPFPGQTAVGLSTAVRVTFQ